MRRLGIRVQRDILEGRSPPRAPFDDRRQGLGLVEADPVLVLEAVEQGARQQVDPDVGMLTSPEPLFAL